MWYLGFLVVLVTLCSRSEGHEGHEHEVDSAAADKIKLKISQNKWEASDLVDMEHLKSELREVLQLQSKGELTEEEASVYLFRTHDFDGNSKLDGIEIGSILRHTIGDNSTEDLVEKAVDNTMDMDSNNDGYITYAELKHQLEQQKAQHASAPVEL